LSAEGKKVIVIGGGDTGSDCVGISIRQGAKSVLQIELLPQPPEGSNSQTPWPQWPNILRTSSSHEEGCERQWSILTKAFIENPSGEISAIKVVDIEWSTKEEGGMSFNEISGTEREIECDLVLLAMGFLKGETNLMEKDLDIETSERGLLKTHNYQTENKMVFAAGDMRRGQSLVVWAISEGREAAFYVDKYLMVSSMLEQKDHSEEIWRNKLKKREFNYF
jgi:glutamate synthase (NADPH/NADH) small chain